MLLLIHFLFAILGVMLKKNGPNTSEYLHELKLDPSQKCTVYADMPSCFFFLTGQWSHSSLPQKSLRERGLTLMYVPLSFIVNGK